MKNKNIGYLFLLVEGTCTEQEFFTDIFKNIFGCHVISDDTRDRFLSKSVQDQLNKTLSLLTDKSSNVIVIKAAPYSQMHSSLDSAFDDYDDIPKLYGVRNADLFNTIMIFDKDIESGNLNTILKHYFDYYNEYSDNGLLIVSYPCIESFMIAMYDLNIQYFTNSKSAKKIYQNYARLPICSSGLIQSIEYNLKQFKKINSCDQFEFESFFATLGEQDKKMEDNYFLHGRWESYSMLFIIFLIFDLYDFN